MRSRRLPRALRACQEVVSLDGKELRRAYEKGLAASPPLTVSAFAAETRLCLAAVSPGAGENEVEAALKVVELIDLTGEWSRLTRSTATRAWHKPLLNGAAITCSRSREIAAIGWLTPTKV